MYPNLKWIIVGGSPCQDLTFAGPSQGLLGLVGSQSRLFFVLLCTIRTMQILVGPQFTRYLVENAGSMKLVHCVVCCKLLGLPHEPLQRYIWELSKYTPYITRKRNFFRNFADIEPVKKFATSLIRNFAHCSITKGNIIPFAPGKKGKMAWSLVFPRPTKMLTSGMQSMTRPSAPLKQFGPRLRGTCQASRVTSCSWLKVTLLLCCS